MAIFHLQMKPISRASGRGAPGAAAYRAGERLRDERTGRSYDFTHRLDVRHAQIILPAALETAAPEWIRHRSALWNAAESSERLRNSRVAREYEIGLPAELSAMQRLELATAFARELADRYRVAVDLAVHDPRPGGDSRNFHAHLLTTTREVTSDGLGAKASPEWNGTRRFRQGLPSGREELRAVRERWAILANEALKAANLDLRIDHRSLAAQGIDREPVPRYPYGVVLRERRGLHSEVAERIRAQYQARVRAREERSAVAGPAPDAPPRIALHEVQRAGREAWLELRRSMQTGIDAATPQSAASRDGALETTATVDAGRRAACDRDFSL